MDDMVSARPTLAAWLEEYAAIEREFVAAMAAEGPVFAPRAAGRPRADELRETLRERGARFMNGGASVSTGFLSSACAACVGGCGSRTFYINLRCNRNCYFCFNPNQADFEEHCARDTPWREELEAFGREVAEVTHVGLTGGEPLLCSDEALAFFARARELYPDAHLRLYTSGMGLDEAFCAKAAECGLNEIRFSVKLDEGEGAVEEALAAIALARRFPFDAMVEMPVVPAELERMKLLLRQLDDLGVRGINLLELCYPHRNWGDFARRGLALKNPPFEVLYDYGYAAAWPWPAARRRAWSSCCSLLTRGFPWACIAARWTTRTATRCCRETAPLRWTPRSTSWATTASTARRRRSTATRKRSAPTWTGSVRATAWRKTACRFIPRALPRRSDWASFPFSRGTWSRDRAPMRIFAN